MKEQVTKLTFKNQEIYVGIDVHLKNWSVQILSERSTLKRFQQDPSAKALHSYLVRNYPEATYHSVYEAGFSGFSAHYQLTELGINNIVVNPADVPTMGKEKLHKSDAIDCAKLARSLRNGDLKGIYIPSIEALQVRSLVRFRHSVVKDKTRIQSRIKSLLNFYGVCMPNEFSNNKSHWSKKFMNWLNSIEFK